jgi:hypothetical protein
MCNNREIETIEHLFFGCVFAKRCWNKIGITWVQDVDLHRRFLRTKQLAGLRFFTEISLIAAWESWKVRNRKVFDGIQATFDRWLCNFKEEAALQSHRVVDCDRSLVLAWLDSL